jgi:hypothetical protein
VPTPPDAELREKVARFRAADGDEDRELLLRAFAAQTAIRWPVLDEMIEPA